MFAQILNIWVLVSASFLPLLTYLEKVDHLSRSLALSLSRFFVLSLSLSLSISLYTHKYIYIYIPQTELALVGFLLVFYSN